MTVGPGVVVSCSQRPIMMKTLLNETQSDAQTILPVKHNEPKLTRLNSEQLCVSLHKVYTGLHHRPDPPKIPCSFNNSLL